MNPPVKGNALYWIFGTQFGQSFTATSDVRELDAIAVFYAAGNLGSGDPSVTATLYSGEGMLGTILGTAGPVQINSRTTPSGSEIVFGFSGLTLVPGQRYTIDVDPQGPRAGGLMQGGGNYPGGVAYSNGASNSNNDFAFQITGVPETSNLGLIVPGLIVILLRRGRP